MEATVERKPLLAALTRLAPFVAKRSALPVLQGVRVTAVTEGARLVFEATDLEVSVTTEVEAKPLDDGVAVLAFTDLRRAVKAVANGPLSLAFNPDGSVTLADGIRTVGIETYPTEDYPETLVSADDVAGWKFVRGEKLIELMGRVGVAASGDDARPILTCLALEPGKDGLSVVATDSYRLAWQTIPNEVELKATILVPARFVKAVAKAGITHVGHVSDNSNREKPRPSHFVAAGPGFVALVRLVEGGFPDWRKLIATEAPTTWTFDPAELAAIKAMKNEHVPVRINLETATVTTSHDGRVSSMTLGGERMTAAAYPIAFNPDYLADVTKVIKAERIEMATIDGLKPAVFRAEGEPSYLLMPVRV